MGLKRNKGICYVHTFSNIYYRHTSDRWKTYGSNLTNQICWPLRSAMKLFGNYLQFGYAQGQALILSPLLCSLPPLGLVKHYYYCLCPPLTSLDFRQVYRAFKQFLQSVIPVPHWKTPASTRSNFNRPVTTSHLQFLCTLSLWHKSHNNFLVQFKQKSPTLAGILLFPCLPFMLGPIHITSFLTMV